MTEPDCIMQPIQRNDLIMVHGDYLAALVAAFHALCLRVDFAGGNPTDLERRRVDEVRKIEGSA